MTSPESQALANPPVANLLEIRHRLLDCSNTLPHQNPKIGAALIVLKPRRSLVARIRSHIRRRKLLEPILLDSHIRRLCACFSDDKMLVEALCVGIIEVSVGTVEGVAGVCGIVIQAHDVDVVGTRPVRADVAGGGGVRRPVHEAAVDVSNGGMDSLPCGDELLRSWRGSVSSASSVTEVSRILTARVCRGVLPAARAADVAVHLVAETEPDFDAVVGELLDHIRDIVRDVRRDLAKASGNLRHDSRDEDGTGALEIIHGLSKLGSVPAAARDLSIPGVAGSEVNG